MKPNSVSGRLLSRPGRQQERYLLGHQIRSYVLDQSRVKDLRTNVETGNTTAVLDGALEPFIEASLKQEFEREDSHHYYRCL